jgi:hypothetical protein
MQSGVYEFFGVNYYTRGTGLVLVFPFVVWLFFAVILLLSQLTENFFEKADKPLKWRSVLIPAAMIPISFVVAFWDVYLIGQQATKLCKEQAGLHVYKTVEADGFIGDSSIDYWSKFGFKFVEYQMGNGEKYRYVLLNGDVKKISVDNLLSSYEIISSDSIVTNKISEYSYAIVDVNSKQVISSLKKYSIDCGWSDMVMYSVSGFSYTPWICSGISTGINLNVRDLIKHSIIPK